MLPDQKFEHHLTTPGNLSQLAEVFFYYDNFDQPMMTLIVHLCSRWTRRDNIRKKKLVVDVRQQQRRIKLAAEQMLGIIFLYKLV